MRSRKNKRKKEMNLNSSDSILNPKTSFPVYEAYKAARTSLMALMERETRKIITVTSALPEEGKTVSTINLAITMAQSGKKVLIIDADMRESRVSRYLKYAGGRGLSNYLRGETEEVTVFTFEHQYGTFHVIPAGSVPENPVELLMLEEMGKLLENVQKEYDYIFIDTPPINVVTDATALHHWVTGYLLVVRAGFSEIDAVQEMVIEFEKLDAKILGFFIHDINARGNGYGYGGRYKYGKYERYGSYQRRYVEAKV